MEEDDEVEHPVARELFRQSSFEVRLSPTLPSSSSSSENEEEVENVAPRIVDAVLKNPVIMITEVQATQRVDDVSLNGSTSKSGQISNSKSEMFLDDAETDSEVTVIMSPGDDGSVGTMKGKLNETFCLDEFEQNL